MFAAGRLTVILSAVASESRSDGAAEDGERCKCAVPTGAL